MSIQIAQSFSPASIEGREACYSAVKKSDLLPARELGKLIKRCCLNDRMSQKEIYRYFYGYAMAICNRYANNNNDAIEILNDGFLKIFRQICHYKPADTDATGSFKVWLRKIMVHAAIDHFRKNYQHHFETGAENEIIKLSAAGEDEVDRISYQVLIRFLQELTPGYRIVFNLFIIDGFTHEEISKQLGVSVGTSKSNLAKAREQLHTKLFRHSSYIC
ncbi:MAG: sigma-70 family RNA polymerase sigma factor [Ferruginibacter sp.]